MRDDHALVKIGDSLIPLIGVDPDAGKEICDSCKRKLRLWEIAIVDDKFLCETCHLNALLADLNLRLKKRFLQ